MTCYAGLSKCAVDFFMNNSHEIEVSFKKIVVKLCVYPYAPVGDCNCNKMLSYFG